MKKKQRYITAPIISPNPDLMGWGVIEDINNAKPLALSFPVKGDAERVCEFVNAAYAKGLRARDSDNV